MKKRANGFQARLGAHGHPRPCARLVNRLAGCLRANLDTLYRSDAQNGRPVNETRATVAAAGLLRYFAALRYPARRLIPVEAPT